MGPVQENSSFYCKKSIPYEIFNLQLETHVKLVTYFLFVALKRQYG